MKYRELLTKVRSQSKFIEKLKERKNKLLVDLRFEKERTQALERNFEKVIKEDRRLIKDIKANVFKTLYLKIRDKIGGGRI